MRAMYGKYPEYHTSLDNKSLISFEKMAQTIELYAHVCQVLEMNQTYRNYFLFVSHNWEKEDCIKV